MMKLRGSVYAGEKTLVATRSHGSFLLPAAFSGFLSVTCFSFASTMSGTSSFFSILGYALAILCAWVTLKKLYTWASTHYVLTNYRLMIYQGMGKARSVEIPLEFIEGVNARKTFIGVGGSCRLFIHSQGIVHVIRHIPRGQQFSQEIYNAQKSFLTTRYGGY